MSVCWPRGGLLDDFQGVLGVVWKGNEAKGFGIRKAGEEAGAVELVQLSF
jgi:hypothetical protein